MACLLASFELENASAVGDFPLVACRLLALTGTDYKVQSSSALSVLTPPCERLFTPPERKLHSISIDDGMLSQFKSLSS